jgi:squalene-hopene/tetraprenyl-beta-curcumene cyclase
LQNYVTSINVMALNAANGRRNTRRSSATASSSSRNCNGTKEEGKSEKDDFYGGAGYDSKSRPDLSNTHFFVEALHAAGVPADDPALKTKALVFVSRCQNLKSEFNDRPYAGKINDGSFIYSAAGGGQTKTSDDPKNEKLTGYGSMTYAGIKSMIYCGVGKEDPRYKAAYEWIQKNYTLDANPGMPPELAHRGLYYYYHVMAKTLECDGYRRVRRCRGEQARLEGRIDRRHRQTAKAGRQLSSTTTTAGWKAIPIWSPVMC